MIGGLGSAVAEVLAELDGPQVRFRRLGLPSAFAPQVGSQAWLEAQHGLDQAGVLRAAQALLAG